MGDARPTLKSTLLFNKLRLHDYYLLKLRDVTTVDFPYGLGLLCAPLSDRNALEYSGPRIGLMYVSKRLVDQKGVFDHA